MPSFLLKNIDRKFWKRVKVQAAKDDVKLNELALKLFAEYVNRKPLTEEAREARR